MAISSSRSITLLLLITGLSLIRNSYAWLSSSHYGASILASLRNNGFSRRSSFVVAPLAIASISVDALEDHDQVGSELAGSVQRWLDAEWMVQDCHIRIGQACKATYIKCRRDDNQADLMTIMMEVAQTLERDWKKSYDDAFVNPWDISNYVSVYLTAKVGIEGCDCSAKIY